MVHKWPLSKEQSAEKALNVLNVCVAILALLLLGVGLVGFRRFV
jgi:hypothetical protein